MMDDRFDNKLPGSLRFRFTRWRVAYVVIAILAIGVWLNVVWLSPPSATPENRIANLTEPLGGRQSDIAVKASNAKNSRNGKIPKTAARAFIISGSKEGAKPDVQEGGKNTERTDSALDIPEIRGGFSISGMVVDETGKPIPDIQLMVSLRNPFTEEGNMNIPESERQRQAVTESDGYFKIQGLEGGEYEIRNNANRLYQEASIVVRTGVESADLILRKKQPDIRVYGTIQSRGEPLSGVSVVSAGQSKNTVYSDEEGRYNLVVDTSSGLPIYSLRFSHQDYREQTSELRTEDMQKGEDVKLDLELQPINELAEVTGILRSSAGSSVSDEKVQLYSKTVKHSYFAVSDQAGAFLFPEVEPAPDYVLSVLPIGNYQDYSQKNLEIDSSRANNVDVVLEPLKLGTLSGQMVDPNGNPISDFSLWLHNNGASSFPATNVFSDREGRFVVNEIPEGNLIFDTRSSPLFSITGINQPPGQEKEVTLVLDWGANVVAGRIVDSNGSPVPAAVLSLTWFYSNGEIRSNSTRQAVTNSEGYFNFSRVGPGMHTLRIGIPGYRYTQRDYTVGAETTAPDILIKLEGA